MNVLVLDGNENQSVAAVRSLARAGHRVRVGAPTKWSKAGWSRYCAGQFVYVSPERDAEAFVACILKETQRDPGALVLPMTERTTLPLSASRDKVFAAGGRMVLPSHATVLRCFDKLETLQIAESLGVKVPRTVVIEDPSQARELAPTLPYPVVLKPRTSCTVSLEGQVHSSGRPHYGRNPEEFLTAYENLRGRAPSVLIQEYIEGRGAGYFALMHHGEVRAEFAHQRIRDARPTGSGSSVRVSTAMDPQARGAGLGILRALKWHGVAMVEFRVTPTGTPTFMEVNGRFWHSLALAVYSGVDFPALMALMASESDVNPLVGYRTGVRCRWLLGDFRHLVEVMRGAPAGFPGRFPGRLRTLASFFVPTPGTFHDNFMLVDPLPELGDWLDFLLHRIPTAARRRRAPIQDESSAAKSYTHQ